MNENKYLYNTMDLFLAVISFKLNQRDILEIAWDGLEGNIVQAFLFNIRLAKLWQAHILKGRDRCQVHPSQ